MESRSVVGEAVSVDTSRLERFVARSASARSRLDRVLSSLQRRHHRLGLLAPTSVCAPGSRLRAIDQELGVTDQHVTDVVAALNGEQGLTTLRSSHPVPGLVCVAPAPSGRGLADRVEHVLGRDVFDWRRGLETIQTAADGATKIASTLPSSPEFTRLLLTDPAELARRQWSSTLGVGDWIGDSASLVAAASTLVPTPARIVDLASASRAPSDHAGLALVGGMLSVGSGLRSLRPGSVAANRELAEAMVAGTLADHDGLNNAENLVVALLDWEAFERDPNRWFGRLVPDLALDALSAGAGAGRRPMLHLADGATAARARSVAGAPSALDDAGRLRGVIWDERGQPRYEDVDVRSSLTSADAAAIRDYTGHASYELNRASRSGLESGSEIAARVGEIDAALEVLPHHEVGHLYRSTDLPASVVEDLADSRVFADPGFLSTSSVEGEAVLFGGRHRLIIEESVSGRIFGNSSEFRFESEVVFPRGTQFDVLEITDEGGVTVIRLAERGTP